MDCNSSRGVIAACGGEAHEQSRSRVGRLGSRIGEQGVTFTFLFTFDVIAALLSHALRQHSNMTHKRNARSDDGLDLVQNSPATFSFDGFVQLEEPRAAFALRVLVRDPRNRSCDLSR